MKGYMYQSDFAKLYVAEGHAKGFAEGFAQGFAEGLIEGLAEVGAVQRVGEWATALLAVLRIRGVAVPDTIREHLLAKKDSGPLERWLKKSLIPGPAAADGTTSPSADAKVIPQRLQRTQEEAPAKLTLGEIENMLAVELLEKGRLEGHKEGEARFFLLLLRSKFGPLDPEIEDRVRSADTGRLLEWSKRALTAGSLQDIFKG